MNGYEIVEKLIQDKRVKVSENEIWTMAENNSIDECVARILLEKKYRAKYYPPMDAHFCGTYHFENPNVEKIKGWGIYKVNYHSLKLELIEKCPDNMLKLMLKEIAKENDEDETQFSYELLKNKYFLSKQDTTYLLHEIYMYPL